MKKKVNKELKEINQKAEVIVETLKMVQKIEKKYKCILTFNIDGICFPKKR